MNWSEFESITGTKISNHQSIGGGGINQAYLVEFSEPQNFPKKCFLKTHSNPPEKMYQVEALGLEELKKSQTFKIPRVHFTHDKYLLMDWIECGTKPKDFYQKAGNLLAKMHRTSSENLCHGFYSNNFIGSTPQINDWTKDWLTFFRNRRLAPQIRMAAEYLDQDVRSQFHKLFNLLPNLITDEEPPSLCHGDLWGGNHLCDENGIPVLIDPAVFYGHRESDLAFTTLFNGYPKEFHEAYESDFPLKEGFWETRIHLYQLYHLLNHLNLFGSSYLPNVLEKLRILLHSEK